MIGNKHQDKLTEKNMLEISDHTHTHTTQYPHTLTFHAVPELLSLLLWRLLLMVLVFVGLSSPSSWYILTLSLLLVLVVILLLLV